MHKSLAAGQGQWAMIGAEDSSMRGVVGADGEEILVYDWTVQQHPPRGAAGEEFAVRSTSYIVGASSR